MKSIGSRLWILFLAISVSISTLPLSAVAAPYNCPQGWASVTSQPITNVSLFCYLPNSGGVLDADDVHFVKVNVASVGQYERDPSNPSDLFGVAGDPFTPDPEFLKKSVKDHLADYYPTTDVRMVINGTFFECTGTCGGKSKLSFATYRNTSTINTGSPDDPDPSKRCIAFGNGYTPFSAAWNPWSYNWTSINTALNTTCGTGGPYHRVVGLHPNSVVGPYDSRTYIGYDLGASPDQICFLVGGNMTNSDAVNMMTSMECVAAVQLDGGNSSQLSYIHPVSGTLESPVDGRQDIHRPVPHYFVIFG